MKKLLFVLILLTGTQLVFSQNNHHITIKIKNYTDPSLLITSYYGNKIRIVDTLVAKNPGVFVFDGNKELPGGIYMAVSTKKKKLFEFVVNQQQHFVLTTDTTNYSMDMKVDNSLENQLFFEYMNFNEKQFSASMMLNKKREKFKKGTAEFVKYSHKMDSLKLISGKYRDSIANKFPMTLVSKIFRAMSDMEMSKMPDSKEAFLKMRSQYWGHFALNDPRLFRTPLYEKKVDNYFRNFVPMQPDSVDYQIDRVISKAQGCSECVSYLVWKFTMDYQNPKYMGFDKVFVHLVDHYFEKISIEGTTPSILKLLKKRADALRPLLLGNKAPELVLLDTTGNYQGFRNIHNRYTLLLFWDYHCGVCKQEMKDLVPFYNKYAKTYDLEVYGININPDLDNWKKAVRDRKLPWINVNGTRSIKGDYTKTYDIHGTPQFFLLDRDKKIIAKQFSVSQLQMILDDFAKKNQHQ